MSVHIGKIIKALVKEKGISMEEFASRISNTRRNAYKIFDKETVDTGLLIRISEALDKNLFFEYIKESELEEKFNEKLKSMLAMKAWDNFMSQVKNEEKKKKPVKKAKK